MTFNDDPAYKGVIHTGIDGATGYNIMINAVDHPYNSFYVWEQLYDKAGNPIEGAYVDQNGDNKIDEEDLVAYKKSAPDVFMGLTSQLSYKNWDLSLLCVQVLETMLITMYNPIVRLGMVHKCMTKLVS